MALMAQPALRRKMVTPILIANVVNSDLLLWFPYGLYHCKFEEKM